MPTSKVPIPGYDGYYASRAGQILGKKGSVKQPFLNPENGYLYISMSVGGKSIQRSVHSLVALTFHGPRPQGLDVRHRNGQKQDNRAKNLTYGTRSENMKDSVRHGTNVNAAKEVCNRGHEFDTVNNRGARQCTRCKVERAKERRQ